MSIQHAYTQTVADGTATSVVRPSDWNSNHNMVLNLAGNTLGTSQVSGQDIVWAGGSNVTLSANGSTVSVIGVPAQTTQTQPAGNIAGAGYTFTTQAGTSIGATHNSAGLSIAQPLFLTTAAQSNHSHNFATTTTNGSQIVVGTTNSAGATIGVPPFITTFTQPGATVFSNSNNVSFGLNGSTVTATATFAQSTQTQPAGNIAGVGTTYAGTNVNATLGLNSNGLALSLSAAGGGVTNQTGPNIAAGGSTITDGTVVFSNANGVSFGLNGSTMTASINTAPDQIAILGNTAGTASTFTGDSFFFSGGNNVTLSNNAGTLVFSAAAGGGGGATTYLSAWPDLGERIYAYSTVPFGTSGATGGSTQQTVSAYIASVAIGNYLDITDIDLQAVVTTAAGTGSMTNMAGIGIYTLNGGSAMSLISAFYHVNMISQNSQTAVTATWWWGTNSTSNGGNTNGGSNSLYSGTRRFELVDSPMTWQPGNYYVAMMYTGRSDGANVAPASSLGFISQSTIGASYFGVTSATSPYGGFQGVFSTTSNVSTNLVFPMPASIHTSAITGSNGTQWKQPFVYAYKNK